MMSMKCSDEKNMKDISPRLIHKRYYEVRTASQLVDICITGTPNEALGCAVSPTSTTSGGNGNDKESMT